MAVTKVFKSGNSRAVRLPKRFQLPIGDVEIFYRGDEVVLRLQQPGMRRAFELLSQLSEEAVTDIRDDRPPQERDGL